MTFTSKAVAMLRMVQNFEAGKTEPNPATKRAFEKAGVEFNADGRGVRLKPPKAKGKRK